MAHETTDIKRSLDLIRIAKAAYITTIDENGYPETRAMLNLRNAEKYPGLVSFFKGQGNNLGTYFTTSMSSPKVKRLSKNPKACAYYSKPDEWRGLMIAGKLEIVEDAEVKKALWQSGWTLYYPKGIGDPDYGIIRMCPEFLQGYHQLNYYHLKMGGD